MLPSARRDFDHHCARALAHQPLPATVQQQGGFHRAKGRQRGSNDSTKMSIIDQRLMKRTT
jgi:hypothetical protein